MVKNEMAQLKHSIMLEDRNRMTLGGVKEVTDFSDTAVNLSTTRGKLTIQGRGLNISRLNTETGELFISGEVSLLRYSKEKRKGRMLEGLFK